LNTFKHFLARTMNNFFCINIDILCLYHFKSLILSFRFDVEQEDTDGLSESVDYLIMGYVKHSVPVRDVAHKLYLPHRFYPLNIFPRYEINVLIQFKYFFICALNSFYRVHK